MGKLSSTLEMQAGRVEKTEASEAARRLSEYLGGHPLALTQASSLAWRRKWPATKLLENYKKFPRIVHQKLDPVLLHAGYPLSISTVFLVSFQSLSKDAIMILAIMSFFQIEQIPEDIFILDEDADVPERLEFLKEEIL